MEPDLTQLAHPAFTSESSLVRPLRGGHAAEGLHCSGSPKLGSRERRLQAGRVGEDFPPGCGGASRGRSHLAPAAAFLCGEQLGAQRCVLTAGTEVQGGLVGAG